jgi:prephenate dehydrogenase
MDFEANGQKVTVIAIISAIVTLAVEILKLINDVRADNKEAAVELKKQRTAQIQSIARGIIDRDASRINDAFNNLRRLRESK